MDKHRKALELAGHAGCILLKNGAEIFRVQETMIRILCAYGVTDHNVYVISNGIFATEGEGTDHALSLVRHVPLGGVNLSRIDAVNAVSREICAGKWSMDEAEAALTRVETLTPERPITHIFACALGAASFCYLFGGALLDSVAAFPIGFLLQIYLFAAQKRHSAFMPYIWGSVLVTLLSGLLAACFPALNASWVVIGGIVPMVPGVTFTTSIREFFNGDYLSGVIHCISAVLTAVCIALGVCGGAMLLGLPCGFALGYYDFPGKRCLRLISDTLLAFPTVLIGLLVYAFITYRGPLGEYGLLFTLPGMAIGQAVLALPIVISWTAQAVEGLDPRCRQTLLTLGASGAQVAWGSLKEARYEIGMVCVTAFGRVITEVGIAMMLGGNIRYETRTMTTAIALETSKGEFAQGIALGLVLLLMAFVVNLALAVLRRRGRGDHGRRGGGA